MEKNKMFNEYIENWAQRYADVQELKKELWLTDSEFSYCEHYLVVLLNALTELEGYPTYFDKLVLPKLKKIVESNDAE